MRYTAKALRNGHRQALPLSAASGSDANEVFTLCDPKSMTFSTQQGWADFFRDLNALGGVGSGFLGDRDVSSPLDRSVDL